MRHLPIVALLLMVPGAPFAEAQTPDSVSAGTRVRVRLEGRTSRPVTGAVTGFSPGVLTLKGRDGGALRIHLDSVATLERSVGTRVNTGRGALAGLVGGAVLGAIVGKTTDPHSDCWGHAAEGECRFWLWSAGLFGAAGAGIGALLGKVTRTDVWERVDMSPFARGRGGAWVLRGSMPVR